MKLTSPTQFKPSKRTSPLAMVVGSLVALGLVMLAAGLFIKFGGLEATDGGSPTGLELDLQQAEAGDANAMLLMAQRYLGGVGVTADIHQAVKWFTKAKEAGSADAAHQLGVIQERGDLGEPNFEAARELYIQASKLGNVTAMVALGRLLAAGPENLRNPEAAAIAYQQAAQKGSPIAAESLGFMHATGVLGRIDPQLSWRWLNYALLLWQQPQNQDSGDTGAAMTRLTASLDEMGKRLTEAERQMLNNDPLPPNMPDIRTTKQP